MLRSMTAYGRASIETDVGLFIIEILSVNRKHFEIQMQIPKVLNCFDADIRKWISTVVSRGHVSVRISPQFNESSPVKVSANLPLARELFAAWSEIAEDLNVQNDFSLGLLKDETGILIQHESFIDMTVFNNCLKLAIDAALEPFLEMKDKEGGVLEKDILERVRGIRGMIERVAALAPNAVEKYRAKLKEALEKVSPGNNDDRILKEICIYTDSIDISEEITRFKSHLDQLEQTVKGNGLSVGKKLEFILQELSREINTTGAKASDMEISKLVVEIKSELERIREQVQNVE